MNVIYKIKPATELRSSQKKSSYYLNEIRKNLAANPGRSPLMHSYYYASAGDRPALFARFPLNFVPFIQYAV